MRTYNLTMVGSWFYSWELRKIKIWYQFKNTPEMSSTYIEQQKKKLSKTIKYPFCKRTKTVYVHIIWEQPDSLYVDSCSQWCSQCSKEYARRDCLPISHSWRVQTVFRFLRAIWFIFSFPSLLAFDRGQLAGTACQMFYYVLLQSRLLYTAYLGWQHSADDEEMFFFLISVKLNVYFYYNLTHQWHIRSVAP